ncbi:MAG: hypothetical protein UX28_C0007G0006 [Candidatus Pacebacteria bacterium GW2011_GWA1_46_10]|nr:MAG: hypothetical protein UX28_C0007G0006 [Candidatus Pacebacteria bacterium GW2011_GWA1_46_10]
MKIKLTHYPYYDHQVGAIVDFGEELNKSLSLREKVQAAKKKNLNDDIDV